MISTTHDKPVHVIVNPRSGYGGKKLVLAGLLRALRNAGIDAVEYVTTAAGDARRYAGEVAGEASAVLVWGGDGTVNEVASGLIGTGVPMLPCPAGTENILAKELGAGAEPEKIIATLRRGRVAQCDVGRVNDRNFLMMIGVGFDGEVVRRLSRTRTGHISHLSYFWPIWRTFWEHDWPRLTITSDGERLFDGRGLAFVGNISRYSVGLRICRDALFDDGLLDLVVFSCHRQTALLLHLAWTLLRAHPVRGDVVYRRLRQVRIETAPPAATQVDGDVGPPTPLDVSLAPGRVKLLVPAARDAAGPTTGGHAR